MVAVRRLQRLRQLVVMVVVVERGGRVRDRHRGRGGRGQHVNRDGTKVVVVMVLLVVVVLILMLMQVMGEVVLLVLVVLGVVVVVVEGRPHRLRGHPEEHSSSGRRRRRRGEATRAIRLKHQRGVTTRRSTRWNTAMRRTREQPGVGRIVAGAVCQGCPRLRAFRNKGGVDDRDCAGASVHGCSTTGDKGGGLDKQTRERNKGERTLKCWRRFVRQSGRRDLRQQWHRGRAEWTT